MTKKKDITNEVEQFVAGKQAANSLSGGENATEVHREQELPPIQIHSSHVSDETDGENGLNENGNAGNGTANRTTTTTTTTVDESNGNDGYVPGAFYRHLLENDPNKKRLGDIDAEEQRMKREATMASIADALNAFHTAYAKSRGVQPITDGTSYTGKLRERYDKLQAERNGLKEKGYLNAVNAMKLDEDARRDARNWRRILKRDEVDDNRWDWQKNRTERLDAENAKQREFENAMKREQMDEAKNQNAWARKHGDQQIALQWHDKHKDDVGFVLGDGNGVINVPKKNLNAANISFVFNQLDQAIRDKVPQQKDRWGNNQGTISTEQMLVAIGDAVQRGDQKVVMALRQLAGQKVRINNTANQGSGAGNGAVNWNQYKKTK